jgi:subtilisin family serine protease
MLSLFECNGRLGVIQTILRVSISAAATLILVCLLVPAGGYNSAEALPIRPMVGVDMTPDLSLVRQRGGKRLRGFRTKKAGAHRPGKQFGEHANNHQNHHTPPDHVGSPGDNRPHNNDGKPGGGKNNDGKNNDGKNNDGKNNDGKNNDGKNNDGKPLSFPGGIGRTPPSIHVVCIAGRVHGGRCLCEGGRQELGGSVFVCGSAPQGPVTLAGAAGRPLPPTQPPAPLTAAQQPPATSSQPQFVPDEVVVRMARTMPEAVDLAVAQTHGLQLLERSTIELIGIRLVRYRVLNNRPLAAALTALQADPRTLAPQLNYYYRHLQGGADPSNGLQYALVKLDVARAQAFARGGGTLIAVIDSGVDYTHPDLRGSVVEAFSGVTAAANDPHGTEISGIIAAHGIVRGVAPEANLLDVRVFASDRGRPSTATTFNIVRGIDWALSKRARVLNMSFAGPSDALLEASIKAAAANGAITVAAAGNGGPQAAPAYPAAYPGVIAVTAIDVADRPYTLANRGNYISVAAPGVDVLAPSGNHAHQIVSGTSYAAAHVSGIVALMVERYPTLDAGAARLALTAAAVDLGPPGRDDQFGAGAVNAFAALRAVAGH